MYNNKVILVNFSMHRPYSYWYHTCGRIPR